jgi:hypothetical protein
MMLIVITDKFHSCMQAGDSLLTKLTLGVKGSCIKTRDIEGEVCSSPCHSLLSLPPWLKL